VDTINNLLTLASYDNTLTLGPDAYEQISISVWNNTVVMQIFDAPGGHYQQGNWGVEILVSPSSLTLQRCGGVRFKTNPAAGSSAGRIVAQAWRSGEPLIGGGVQLTGSLTGSGSITPPPNSPLNFQHQGVLVAAEPTLDFVDQDGTIWTVSDDAPNTRIKVSLPNFLQMLTGSGGHTIAISTGTFTWPGGSAQATDVVINHGLTSTPTIIGVFPSVSGVNLVTGSWFGAGVTQFTARAYTTGALPAMGTTTPFAWLAIA